MSEAIKVTIDDHPPRRVLKSDYIRAKTKQLREFGYPTLTEQAVAEALERALEGDHVPGVIATLVRKDNPEKATP